MRIEYHRTLIADRVRNEALFRALEAVIKPGTTTVADIGAGTGLLGLMAAKLGAKEVHLFEAAEVAGVAAAVLQANKARSCHLYPCHSTEMMHPPKVDVVISETLGNYALEENIIATLNDARRRFLKPGGVVLPAKIRQYMCPVTTDRLHRELGAWREIGHGIDLSPALTMSFNNVYVRTLGPADLLKGGRTAACWDEIDLSRETKSARSGKAVWTVQATETVYGLAYWWEADLGNGILLSTAPDRPATHWEQLYFPIERPIALARGELLEARLKSRSSEEAGTHLAWVAIHSDRDGKVLSRQAMDLDKGWIP